MSRGKAMPIPIKAASNIARLYGYDQVIIVARATGEDGQQWCTTYGRNADHCRAAASIGDALRELEAGRKRLVDA